MHSSKIPFFTPFFAFQIQEMKFQRVLLKLSGEALMGKSEFGIETNALSHYAEEIKTIVDLGVQVGIVIGGGNIFRGMQAAKDGLIERSQADYMGMLATVMNGMALQGALEKIGVYTRLQTALNISEVAEPFIRRRSIRHMEKGRVVIFGAGTGNPYFTTDTAAALRAVEINADVLLKGTKVDGIYTADPMKDPEAEKYEVISFDEAYEKRLNVMDMTAFTMCKENEMPIVVFDINTTGNLKQLVQGEAIGTVVSN